MSASRVVRAGLISAGLAGAISWPSISKAAIDLELKEITFDDIAALGREAQVGIRAYKGAEAANAQQSHYGGDPAPGGMAGDQIVGYTLYTLAKNVGTDAVPWGFPVIESDNPWTDANGFTGQESDNHQHTRSTGVGPHPHIRFRIFRNKIGGGVKELIGLSDLKHTYRTANSANHHELPVGDEDPYNHAHNQDQSFYSPYRSGGPNPDGFDETTGTLMAHEHLGTKYRPGADSDRERDHGEATFGGGMFSSGEIMPADAGHPGADNIDHLLQAKGELLDAAGYCYFLVGTYYVVNDVDSGNFDNSNNTMWREFDPGWNGSKFVPRMLSAHGHGLNTLDAHMCVPEPSFAALVLGAALLLGRRRSRRVQRLP